MAKHPRTKCFLANHFSAKGCKVGRCERRATPRRSIVGIGLSGFALIALVAMPGFARAQNGNVGRQEYRNNCAVCHGVDGKGNGPLASILKKKVPDLTVLQKNNKGVFPVQQVYDIIDGTTPVPGHGTPDMPAWGVAFMKQAPPFAGPVAQQKYVTARILALVDYLAGIQVK